MSVLTRVPRSFIPPPRRNVHFAESQGTRAPETSDTSPEATPKATLAATKTDGGKNNPLLLF